MLHVHECVYVCRFTSLPLSYVRGENDNDETGQLNVLAGMNMCMTATCGLCLCTMMITMKMKDDDDVNDVKNVYIFFLHEPSIYSLSPR